MSESQEQKLLPLRIFYSYAQEDEALCQILEKHLSQLRREGKIAEWSRRKIVPGRDSAHEIDANLLSASLILLLISPDFLASDYCYGQDMQRALERHKSGVAQVIPLLLRPVDWEKAPFAHLQYLPRNGQPITLRPNQDEAFLVVARDIRRTIEASFQLQKHQHLVFLLVIYISNPLPNPILKRLTNNRFDKFKAFSL